MTKIAEQHVAIIREGAVTEIELRRPESLNALNGALLQELVLTLERLEQSDGLRVVVVSGAGDKAFVAGADVRAMHDLGPRALADYIELGQRAMRALELFPVPIVAAVHGYALGGGLELALACDIICAARTARFGQPEVNLGIIPGFGGTQRLAHRCGPGVAKRLVYSGDIISAEEALSYGIADVLYEDEDFRERVNHLAESIAAKAPLAVREAKRLFRIRDEEAVLGGLRREGESFLRLFRTDDRREGMEAFLQKRQPKFVGK